MEKLERLKKYKAEEPMFTISKIKEILADLQIETEEKTSREVEGLYSSKVTIKNTNIGTNGKGLSEDYSLASAYGEFIERLQNDFLLILPQKFYAENGEKNISFIHSPDEKMIELNKIIDYNLCPITNTFNAQSKKDLTKLVKENESYKVLCLPFWDVKRRVESYLPIDLLDIRCGSNGLCAGNTREEALIQGICEIFERFAQRKIFFENITPPTIPSNYFKGTKIFKLLKNLEKEKNLSVIIKDCSLGINLPVVGLLLIDKENHKYTFRLGSDPSPITSLERCLSEIYQGKSSVKFVEIQFSENPFFDKSGFLPIEQEKNRNYMLISMMGFGKWTNSIFDITPDYKFSGFYYKKTISDKENLKYLINLIFKLGYDINIRDVSYLGFPSYRVYIPSMSENIPFDTSRLNYYIIADKADSVIRNINNSPMEDLKLLADYVEFHLKYIDYIKDKRFLKNLIVIPHTSEQLSKLSPILLLFMLNYKIKNLKKSFYYINFFVKIYQFNNHREFLYFSCIRDYVKLKIKNYNSNEIEKTLKMFYKEDIVTIIVNLLSNQATIFNHVELPNNFNCDICKLKDNCRAYEVFEYKTKLFEYKKINIIDQKKLSDIY